MGVGDSLGRMRRCVIHWVWRGGGGMGDLGHGVTNGRDVDQAGVHVHGRREERFDIDLLRREPLCLL